MYIHTHILHECVCAHMLGVCAHVLCAFSVISDSLRHRGLEPARLLCPWGFPGENTRVSCHFLLQEIFPTEELNPSLLTLLHWWVHSLPLEPPGKPIYIHAHIYMYVCVCVSFQSFPLLVIRNTEYISLCYMVRPCCFVYFIYVSMLSPFNCV